MEVEAPRVLLFRSQIITSGDFIATDPSPTLDFIPVDFLPDRISPPSGRPQQPRIVPRIRHKQSPIHPLISQQTQRSKALLSSIDNSVLRKLKEKDEKIQKMGKLNRLLREKVRSLMAENQIWRDLAETNEHDASSLRSILRHVLTHGGGADDAESCWGSNDPGRVGAGGGIGGGLPAPPPRLPGMPAGPSRRRGT